MRDLQVESTARRSGIEERQLELTRFLMGEDPLGVVIRAHIHIEHELVEFIRARCHPPDAILAVTEGYARRVKLALKLGLPPEFKEALHMIGDLRNRFAHRPNASIERQDADRLDAALAPDTKAMIDGAYHATSAKLSANVANPPLKQLDPKDRVVLHLISLWAGIAVAAAKAKNVDVRHEDMSVRQRPIA